MIKKNKFSVRFYLLIVLFATLACTIFVGGPDYSNLEPIPVSTEAAQSLRDGIIKSIESGVQTGIVTITITETQITSYLALQMQTDPTLQQDNQEPFFNEPQVYLRDGQMKIYGKTRQGMFSANIGIILNVGIDELGKPKIEVESADFGPFPAPEGINEAVTLFIEEAFTGSFGPVATGLRIETINIAAGVMTLTGRIR
ncbi:MAG TPA: hypothetical protein VMJ90_02845 [Anaerolineales bacterium]|nr:hypothetical protein [Anaerolineales bacterium]